MVRFLVSEVTLYEAEDALVTEGPPLGDVSVCLEGGKHEGGGHREQ